MQSCACTTASACHRAEGMAKGGKETSKGRVSAAARCLHSCILKILIAANTLVRFEHGFEVVT